MAASDPSSSERILVVTLADLGDALLTTPALMMLRQVRPQAHISILTTAVGAAVFRQLPVYDSLIVFEKRRFNNPRQLLRLQSLREAYRLWRELSAGSFTHCLILHHYTTWFGTLKYAALALASGASQRYGLANGRGFFLTDWIRDHGFGARHQAEYWLALVELLGARPDTPRTPSFHVSESERVVAAQRIRLSSMGCPLVALHPGTGNFAPARRWPPQRFAALADALIEDGVRLVLVGGPEEAELRASVLGGMGHASAVQDIGGKTTLDELSAVLAHCALFIGNDSGLAHLASSVGTPVVALFGPTDPRAWGPYGGETWRVEACFDDGVAMLRSGAHRVLKSEIACSPCIYRGHLLGTPQGCPDRTCLLRIDVERALHLVRQRLLEIHNQACVSTT